MNTRGGAQKQSCMSFAFVPRPRHPTHTWPGPSMDNARDFKTPSLHQSSRRHEDTMACRGRLGCSGTLAGVSANHGRCRWLCLPRPTPEIWGCRLPIFHAPMPTQDQPALPLAALAVQSAVGRGGSLPLKSLKP